MSGVVPEQAARVPNLIVLGCGGHARVVLDALHSSDLVGLIDPARAVGERVAQGVVLGGDESLVALRQPAHVAIGDNVRRRTLVERAGSRVWRTILSPLAIVASTGEIAEGCFVGARAVVQPGVRLARHVIVNTGAIIEHDSQIGSFAHIGPGAVLCGSVRVGDSALIGAGATVAPGLSIGRDAVVGAGAVVVRDVPDGATVVGNPARPLKR